MNLKTLLSLDAPRKYEQRALPPCDGGGVKGLNLDAHNLCTRLLLSAVLFVYVIEVHATGLCFCVCVHDHHLVIT